jgi:hypothetical protein
MLKINLSFDTGKQTILELSCTLQKIMKALADADSFFSIPVIRKEKFEDVEIDLSLKDDEVISQIAHTILLFFKKDILTNEKDNVSSINYSRDFGFRLLIQYKNYDSEISFTCSLGGSAINSLAQLSNNGFKLNPELGERILRKLIVDNDLKVIRGAIKVSEIDFLRASKAYVYSLGLITYFSNDFEIPIPNDLEGIEYEFTEKGKYLSVISKEDFREEDMELYKAKLIDVMNQISIRVPAYFK